MTHGDADQCKCPNCKKPIVKPIGDERPLQGGGYAGSGILEIETTCPHCQCKIRCWARWTVTVEIERESKLV